MPSIIFRIQNELYSISSESVIAIIKMPMINSIPLADTNIKGMIRYREQVFKLFNLRRMMKKKSIEEEIRSFVTMIDARAQDHKNWVEELKKSVLENKEFKLTTDPHKCAFGKWYNSYKTDNMFVNDILQELDKPHKKIHKIGIEIEALKASENFDTAKEIIAEIEKFELQEMLGLFEDLKKAFIRNQKELALILTREDNKCAISVDEVLSVEYLSGKDVDQSNLDSLQANTDLFNGLSKTSKGKLVLGLETDQFLNFQNA